ncbi:MAG: hypothetical protein GY874_15575 [Desulfobacteraceae bacterium]|nr:hypothetical protein [Desulfobacteraceae bacterium]
MMNQKEVLKQMIDFNQTTFNNAYNAMVLLHDQLEDITKTAVSQASWMPPESHTTYTDLTKAFKTGRDNFKKYIDESYKKAEEYLTF